MCDGSRRSGAADEAGPKPRPYRGVYWRAHSDHGVVVALPVTALSKPSASASATSSGAAAIATVAGRARTRRSAAASATPIATAEYGLVNIAQPVRMDATS